jgi:hypothetical protein
MEFYLPSLAALLIAGLIVFLILPRLGAPILAVLSLALLAYGVYNHMRLFSNEYRSSTWQERLKDYAPFVTIGVLILFIIGYMGYLFSSGGTSALPASNAPATEAVVNATNAVVNATNQVTNLAEQAFNAVGNATIGAVEGVTNAVQNVAGAVGFGNQRNNGGRSNNTLVNLAKILGTPKRPNA